MKGFLILDRTYKETNRDYYFIYVYIIPEVLKYEFDSLWSTILGSQVPSSIGGKEQHRLETAAPHLSLEGREDVMEIFAAQGAHNYW